MKLTKEEIKNIIEDEIVVDANSDDEVNMGWAIYLGENLNYPFEAEYYQKRRDGKNEWKKVKVIGNETGEGDFSRRSYYVEIELDEIIIPVKLLELRNVKADKEILKVIEVWKYENDNNQ